jgi:copper(I)-binding protein
MKQFIIIFLLLFNTFNACADDSFPNINNYWLRAAPPNAMMMAAYGDLNNDTDQQKVLIGAYSPDFGMVEIHKTIITDGMARMVHQAEIIIKPHGQLSFKPGGLHIMLMQPSKAIKPGDDIKICLIYRQDDKELVQHIMFPVIKK